MNTLPSRKDITIAAIIVLLTLLLNNLIMTAGTKIYATNDGSTPTPTEEPLSQELPAAPARTSVEPRSASVSVGVYTSLALTSSDVPVISYVDQTNGDLKLAVCDIAACTSPAISNLDSTGDVGGDSSIALTSSDVPVISYRDTTNGDLKLAVCNDATCTNPAISTLDSTGFVGSYTSIAVTSSNIPVISYYDLTNRNLKLAVCNDAACTSPTISTLESGGYVGMYTSIALTSSDVPVISYYNNFYANLKLAVCNNTACTNPAISTLDSTSIFNTGGWYTSIALTSSDVPVISYYVHHSSYDLKLAVCNNAACTSPTISTLDSTGDVGGYTSIAVTSSDVPVISYHDGTNGDLKLAVCDDAACTSPTTSTLDSNERVGLFTSLALTSSNLPVVSYYDNTNQNLKLFVAPVTVDEGKPNSFAKSTPTNNATITSTSASLSWSSAVNISSYEYCIATSTADCTTWTSTSTSTTATHTDLVHNTTYYWQVRAINAAGTTYADSESFGQFTVVLPPDAFNKTSPATNATNQPATVTLTWEASTGATSYEYCIATSTDACTAWTSTGTSTTATETGLVHNTTYYWQVRANNAAGTTYADSESFGQFTVVLAPAAFNKTSPANNATNQPATVTLTWAASTRAASYEYCIATSTADCTAWTSTGTSTTATHPGLVHNTSYYWQVRAINAAGTTNADSESFGQFTVVLPPAAFNKTSPANNAVNQPTTVTLTWAASTGATSYEYCIATSTAACTAWTSTGTSTTATKTDLEHNTTYYWQVRANNAAGTTYADSESFGRFSVVLAPAAFNKTSPANNATNQPATVTLTWAASTRAASYEYCIATSTGACTTWTSTGTSTTATKTGLVHNTTYYWQVRAINAAGTTNAGSMSFGQFTVVLPPAAFNMTSPANYAANQSTTVTLTWAASTRAASYEYCVATSTAACTAWTSTGTRTTATETGLVHNTTYYWQVRAINAAGTMNAGSMSFGRFTVILLPAAVNMTTPANNAVNQPTAVTLTWAASTHAISYEYCVALTKAACTTWTGTGASTNATKTGLVQNTTYYWQVRAINTAGTTISSGGYRTFTTRK